MNMDRIPGPGQIYNHFKNKHYQIITVATHTETQEKMVVYQALYGDYRAYIRPLENFMSEVDHEKYPAVTQKYRFELCTDLGIGCKGEEKKAAEKAAYPGENGAGKGIIKASERVNGSRVDEGIAEYVDGHATETTEMGTEGVPDNQVNAVLLEFLEAESYYKKLEVITSNRKHMNDRLINDMAAALDCTVDEGPLDQRIQGLVQCLQAMCRFEDKRLR